MLSNTNISILIIILIIIVTSLLMFKKKNSEKYDSINTFSIPPSAYDQLMQPKIPQSWNNPQTSTDFNISYDKSIPQGDYNFYSDKYVCATPWEEYAVYPDSCGQYGIGEAVEGPEGYKRCVCKAYEKSGKPIQGKTLNNNDIVIDYNAVCTTNEQCKTKYCGNVEGQFSKICQCPPETQWNDDKQTCINPNLYLQKYNIKDSPYLCKTSGKLALSNNDCSLGEAVTPSGFCACQLAYPTSKEAGKIMIGGICTMDEQCVNNSICKPDISSGGKVNTCQCKTGMKANIRYNGPTTCECYNDNDIYDENKQKCVNKNNIVSPICPNTSNGNLVSCNGNIDCGNGEYCDITTAKCICNADLYSGKINEGGKCNNNIQCKSNFCMEYNEEKVCYPEQKSTPYKIATNEYSF